MDHDHHTDRDDDVVTLFMHPAQTLLRILGLKVTEDGDVEDAADVRLEKRRGQQQRHRDDVVEERRSLAEVLHLLQKLGEVESRDGHKHVLDHETELDQALLDHRLLPSRRGTLLFRFCSCDGNGTSANRPSCCGRGFHSIILLLLLLRARFLGRFILVGDLYLLSVRGGDRGGGLLCRQQVMPALQQALHAGYDDDRELVPHLPPVTRKR